MEGTKHNKGLQSWKSFPIQQQPRWPCQEALEDAVESVRNLPPIVSPVEVLKLRDELGAIAEGRGFVLQGGDCAERFSDCKADVIETKIRLLLQMSGVLRHSTDEPCTVVARIAGQYGKPRSSCPLTEDPRKIFRGDNIHSYDDIEQRTPNPQRLIRGYFTSSTVMNYIRSLLKDGFDDIVHFPKSWDLDFLGSADNMREHKEILARIHEDAYLRQDIQASDKTDINIAHEAILLDYEAAMTREVEGKHYNLSAPFVWIGDRTRQLDHAHIEYIRQIENPIGIKVGPSMEGEELIQLLQMVWPNPEINPGRVTLITRYGVPNVERCLRKHIEAVQSTGYKVVWVCDPCHGNTQLSQQSGLKFRNAEMLFEELRLNIETHRAMGSRLGGVHLELTGEDVTECIGGPERLSEADLPRRFESQCDPRMNYTQSMDFALKLAKVLRDNKATDTASA